MTTHSHARGGSKTPHPIRGAYPSPSALQGICLPACLPTRTADRRRPRRSKDWGARRSAACRSPFARQCQAHPCHGHAASRRRPLCACLLPCQTDPLAFRCRHPPCRLPACSALPACLPACLPVPACLPAASHVGSPAPSTLSGSPACPPSTLSGSPACPPCLVPSGAPPRVLACPPAYHLPLLHLPCQTDRLAFRLPPSAVLPACHPAHRLAGGSPAPSPLGGSPACLPCLMPPTVRLARRSACADRPIPTASRLPPPSLLCPTDCCAPPFAAACRAAACAACLPPRTADRRRHRRSANRWHPYHARLAADRREPLPACQPAPRPAHTVTARRIASDLPATLPPCRHLPTFAMSFHRARRCAGALRRQLPLPRQPNPATNEPTRKPLAATGSPASPPPRRPPLHHLSAFLPSCRLHRFLPLRVLPACPPCPRRPPLTPPPRLPPPHLLACLPTRPLARPANPVAAPAGPSQRFQLHRSKPACSSAAMRRSQSGLAPRLHEAPQTSQRKPKPAARLRAHS